MILALHLPTQLGAAAVDHRDLPARDGAAAVRRAGDGIDSSLRDARYAVGNRRVTGKALIFSLAVHGSLICAVMALLPEYQPQSRASFEADQSVEITTDFVPDQTSFESQNLQSEATELRPWEKIPTTLNVTPERTAVEAPELTPQELAQLNAQAPESRLKWPNRRWPLCRRPLIPSPVSSPKRTSCRTTTPLHLRPLSTRSRCCPPLRLRGQLQR